MIRPCDLHLHSHYSDGNLSPEELVAHARSQNLSAVSITDHDTCLGQGEALSAGEKLGIEIITGIEFSVRDEGTSIHILGYHFDHTDNALGESLLELERGRLERARTIVGKLGALGISCSFDDVVKLAGRGTIGRPHIAKILLETGVVRGIQEAFNRFIGAGATCYVPKKVLHLDQVISLIEGAGGVAVWAHPGPLIRNEALLERLCSAGIKGLEAWHPNHTRRLSDEVQRAALGRNLFCTGGSDYHFTEAMQSPVGGIAVSYDAVNAIKRAAGS